MSTNAVNPEFSARARDILSKKIEEGRISAAGLFERINTEAPRDALVKGSAMTFFPGEAAIAIGYGGQTRGIHRHALSQLAQRAGIPGQYLAGLVAGEGWQTELATTVLDRHYNVGEGSTRFLAREVKGEVRGVLSDKYRRLDSRPLVEAFAAECQKIGAVPVDGTVTDTRVALKAIIPTLYEPVPGEVLAFGVEWGNSDYGAGTHALRMFIFRLWCANGATMENAMAQVHLGARLSDDVELSQRTYALDTRTSISAMRDVVSGLLAPAKIEQLREGIRVADEKKVEWKNISSKLAKRLLKGELDEARRAFESDDVINLPAGKSVWRASNALSWIAGRTDDADRRLELQRIAGEVINGKSDAEVSA